MGDHNFEAWCSQHQMHPDACFEKHRPDVKEVRGALSAEESTAAIQKRHREMGGGSARN